MDQPRPVNNIFFSTWFGHELTSPGSTGSGVELLPVQGRYSEGQRFADSCSLLEQVCGFLALLVIYNYWAIVGLT